MPQVCRHKTLDDFVLKHDAYDHSPILCSTAPSSPVILPTYRRCNRFVDYMRVVEPLRYASQFENMYCSDVVQRRMEQRQKEREMVKFVTKRKPKTKITPIELPKKSILPPKQTNKPTLVLDLDLTVVLSRASQQIFQRGEALTNSYEPFYYEDGLHTAYRAHLIPFLEFCHENFEVVVWSAGESDYVRTRLDSTGMIEYVDFVLTRGFCTIKDGQYIKNLEDLGRDLQNTVLLDDSFASCLLSVRNCVPVRRFDGKEDDELLQLIVLLRKILQYPSIVRGIEVQIGFDSASYSILIHRSLRSNASNVSNSSLDKCENRKLCDLIDLELEDDDQPCLVDDSDIFDGQDEYVTSPQMSPAQVMDSYLQNARIYRDSSLQSNILQQMYRSSQKTARKTTQILSSQKVQIGKTKQTDSFDAQLRADNEYIRIRSRASILAMGKIDKMYAEAQKSISTGSKNSSSDQNQSSLFDLPTSRSIVNTRIKPGSVVRRFTDIDLNKTQTQ